MFDDEQVLVEGQEEEAPITSMTFFETSLTEINLDKFLRFNQNKRSFGGDIQHFFILYESEIPLNLWKFSIAWGSTFEEGRIDFKLLYKKQSPFIQCYLVPNKDYHNDMRLTIYFDPQFQTPSDKKEYETLELLVTLTLTLLNNFFSKAFTTEQTKCFKEKGVNCLPLKFISRSQASHPPERIDWQNLKRLEDSSGTACGRLNKFYSDLGFHKRPVENDYIFDIIE
jgi:hypothetical protein